MVKVPGGGRLRRQTTTKSSSLKKLKVHVKLQQSISASSTGFSHVEVDRKLQSDPDVDRNP